MLASLPRARGAVTAARTVPCGGQLVCVGGTGAVVTVGVGTRVGGGVLPGLTVGVGLLVGGGFTPVLPPAARNKMREQPSSAKMQRENRVVRIVFLHKSFSEYLTC